jgi:predicted enzyme related to lactoylglutathione lyase
MGLFGGVFAGRPAPADRAHYLDCAARLIIHLLNSEAESIIEDDDMITEVAFTGTPVTDIKRARAFYEGVLGLKPTMESAGGSWVEYDLGSGTFGIGSYGDVWKPSPHGTCVAFEVDDLDAEVARLKAKGVPVTMEITTTPVCRFAIICDPDGNRLMLHKLGARP